MKCFPSLATSNAKICTWPSPNRRFQSDNSSRAFVIESEIVATWCGICYLLKNSIKVKLVSLAATLVRFNLIQFVALFAFQNAVCFGDTPDLLLCVHFENTKCLLILFSPSSALVLSFGYLHESSQELRRC